MRENINAVRADSGSIGSREEESIILFHKYS